MALRAPKEVAAQNEALFNALPGPLKKALIEDPAAFPGLIEKLVELNKEDERILSTASDLNEALGKQIFNDSDNSEIDESSGVRAALANQLSDGASAAPARPRRFLPSINPNIASVLSDRESLEAFREQLPGVAALGRRVGAGLLKRAAYRTEQSVLLPESARRTFSNVNNRLAEVIEPDQMSEEEKK
jgi:hypothetical protein